MVELCRGLGSVHGAAIALECTPSVRCALRTCGRRYSWNGYKSDKKVAVIGFHT